MKASRRAAQRRHSERVWIAAVQTLSAHAIVLRKAMDRIDQHDEKLGIGRPIGSWGRV